MSRKRERRWRFHNARGDGSWLYLMASVDKWCMVRHSGCIPFAIPLSEWEAMPATPPPAPPGPDGATPGRG